MAPSSGWAGDEGADWNTIESERIAADAVRKVSGLARQNRARSRQVRSDSGADSRRHADAAHDERLRRAAGGRRPFVPVEARRRNGLNEKLFDERVTIISDPMEKNAETSPFTGGGLPVGRETWVEKGVLKTLSYSRFWADRKRVAAEAAGIRTS